MNYLDEHLLPGQLGRFFIVLSLVASLVATFAYFKTVRSKNDIDGGYWKKLARYAFIVELLSVFTIFGLLFYIISHHLFEYKYAWQHSSRQLEPKYLLACFWEGQEGSFLLWSIWHCVLGLILIKTAKKWEAPVMTVISFAQFCIASMIVGVYLFGEKIGSNPFVLIRDSGFLDTTPIAHVGMDVNGPIRPDYLRLPFMQDGNDLNVLLQNYWMVIHPPVLFMGFASTIVPFSFAFAGLWKKNFGEWTKPALPWALFSAAVLGVGIMMGAAWAYESLSFGGYWAWDPVENASLVPWLILIAGIHTLLIYKHTGHSLRTTHLFFILSFGFVLYSTFLTRTGILGDTSVHAFTGEGKSLFYHLQLFMGLSLIPAFVLYFINYKDIPSIKQEESGSSREFWMFIGSLVFFLSAIVIIGKTSLPVLNKIMSSLSGFLPFKFLKQAIAPPEDPEFAYNQIQIFVAIIIAVLTGLTQYLKYKNTSSKFFWKQVLVPLILSAVAATLVLAFGDVTYYHPRGGYGFLAAIWMGIACSVYAVVANAAYIWIGLKGKLKLSGGSIAHVGFGLVLLGILLSSSKKEILSYNTSGISIPFDATSKEKTGENLTLVKGVKNDMGRYWVTYENDEQHPVKKEKWFFNIHFQRKDGKEEFMLRPSAYIKVKGNEGIQPEPDSRHYLDHDVFVYLTALPAPEKNKDTASFSPRTVSVGDTIFYTNGFMIVDRVMANPSDEKYHYSRSDTALVANITVFSKQGTRYHLRPVFYVKNNQANYILDTALSQNLIVAFTQVTLDKKVVLQVKESNSVMKYVTMKAYKFPFINVLWLGIIITALGILISMVRRIQLNRSSKTGP